MLVHDYSDRLVIATGVHDRISRICDSSHGVSGALCDHHDTGKHMHKPPEDPQNGNGSRRKFNVDVDMQ